MNQSIIKKSNTVVNHETIKLINYEATKLITTNQSINYETTKLTSNQSLNPPTNQPVIQSMHVKKKSYEGKAKTC